MKLPFDTDTGIGTRATFGVVVLETDETLERDFARLFDLPGVALHHTRIPMETEIRPDTLAKMEADLPTAVALLPRAARFDAVGYGCTSGATVIGPDGVRAGVQSVLPGTAVTDPLTALIAALKASNVQRLGFLTPYLPEVSQAMRARLEAAGISIAGFGSFEESDDRVVARITPAAILAGIEAVAAQAPCDAVFASCTNLRVQDILRDAEARTGVPVIGSNQALAWHMMRLAGLKDAPVAGGRLFSL